MPIISKLLVMFREERYDGTAIAFFLLEVCHLFGARVMALVSVRSVECSKYIHEHVQLKAATPIAQIQPPDTVKRFGGILAASALLQT